MSHLTHAVNCTFHHSPSDAVDLISSTVKLPIKYDEKSSKLFYPCFFPAANQIRSKLHDFLSQFPQIWFSIDLPIHFGYAYLPFDANIGNDIHVSFGSLLSTSKFLIHDIPFYDRSRWTMTFHNERTLLIKCQDDNNLRSSIELTLSMECLNTSILVVETDTFSSIILSIDSMTRMIQEYSHKHKSKLCGTHPTIQLLARCSDILVRISPTSDADKFLDFLRIKHRCQIYYTTIAIESSICKQWDKIEYNWYPPNDGIYSMALLHSLGYLFDDKYAMNQQLQNIMIELAEEDGKRFYQLAENAFAELQKYHWLDLTTIFNRDQFNHIKIKGDDKLHHVVGVVYLTPTRLLVMPKETTIGHRAIRHESFQGAKNFCLVHLKPDRPDAYLNNNMDYFQEIFRSGIELGVERFHLFGSSNSQTKKHSFWFIKATSFDVINQKRLQLGQLDRIDNLGTYVARLGLWFSKSSPTDIKLNYCQNEKEFELRVQQREICVMIMNDIQRNDYCFTDGNGFISKGLARRVAEKLSLCSKNSQHDIFPSAYQIRMAGCKGLLIVDPQSKFDQFYIKIRPSMKKFEYNDWTLDICEYSQSTPTRLNNQIILLLSDLGVPDITFLRLQKQWFDRGASRYSDLVDNKIPLPVNECRYMYGCAFETRLKPGQCFIRYQVLYDNGKPLLNSQFQCVQGSVIVTKNPCPYAGDMLVLTAVDLPELHDLNDVIVFSTEGDRPDFHKIAGSDLDGDQYFVYWGQEFRLQFSVPPLDYTAEKNIIHPTSITPEDVIQYYLSKLGATSYGEIYNLHAVVVDRNNEKHPRRTCQQSAIKLARMFASAIDSGKTGYVIDKEHIKDLRETYGYNYPDFLRKYDRSSYRSKSIIGILYRNACSYKNGNVDELNDAFAHLHMDNNRLHVSTPMPLNSLPLNNSTRLVNSGKKKTTTRQGN